MRTLGIFLCMLVLACAAMAAPELSWPPLPEHNGEAVLPAQEWPQRPGPRDITVYLAYPGGALAHVTPDTGLMLFLHNWGGTAWRGAPDPAQAIPRYNIIAIGVDYLQSGPFDAAADPPYDFGYLQAMDAIRALWWVYDRLTGMDKPFARGRIYATGGSGGGNVSLMVNKFAPRTFACIVDLCGMAKLSDDIAFGLPGGSRLNAGYQRDGEAARALPLHAQEIRFAGFPPHLEHMRALGNAARVISVHGVEDDACPVEDKREMVENMQAAGLSVTGHFITPDDLDGEAFTSAGHALGDRTRILFKVAGRYLLPDAPDAARSAQPNDFDCRDEAVSYAVSGGRYLVSYREGYPVIRFDAAPR